MKELLTTVNVLHISHTDLDGYGCQYITSKVYHPDNIEFINLDYGNVDDYVINLVNTFDGQYSKILITDLNLKLKNM